MPSLRKKVSSYLRQLSFYHEPRRHNINENAFVTKYLQGQIHLREGPPIIYGEVPTNLPNYELGNYESGSNSVVCCYSGPNGGLTTVKRTEKHLSVPDDDIDFIDNPEDELSDESTESANQTSTFIDDSALPAEWNRKSDFCYGISDSLYDKNQATKLKNGDPIADCFGIITRNDSAILAVADGVNWGEKASIAAKSAVHGSLHYLNKIIFNDTKPFENLTNKTEEGTLNNGSLNPCETANLVSNTREVFVSLLRAFNCAHDLILENEGMLTTLTIAVVLPLRQSNGAQDFQYVCCVCNVGDSLAYVYSQKNGIRELTKGSHDVNRNRDMRDALGALGPVDGINPELSNLTLSITTLHKGDIVLVASDGLTDNFDPNVCRFTVNKKPEKGAIVREKQKRTAVRGEEAKAPDSRLDEVSVQKPPIKPPRRSKPRSSASSASHSERSNSSVEKEIKNSSGQSTSKAQLENPLKAHFMRENSLDEPKKFDKENNLNHQKAPSNKGSTLGTNQAVQAYRIMKAKTSLDLRSQSKIQITRNEDGVPYVTPIQRYELQLLLMEDILRNGISGRDTPVTTARKLCENLLNFTMSITAAKRRTLEDQELYFDNRNGLLVEVSDNQKKIRRKRALEKVQPLPGKLDHVTVVAWNVGNVG